MSPTANTLACPKCAAQYAVGTRFCSSCGTDVSVRPASVEQPTATIERDELLPLVMEGTLGDYDIYGLLGRGGMASVYLALDLSLNRKVAVKVMNPALLMGDDATARFKREAQTAASLSHPHIIPIYGVKQAPRIVYFVMKYIEGRSLDSIVKEIGPLPVEMATAILAQVGSALQYAHKRGIVHRDIKPANIMIDEDGQAIVTDFGIAKVQEAKGLTMTGATVGTPAYMSPEQYEARNITGAADQYSLGVVAYEMLTGHPPFGGDSIMTVMKGHLMEAPPPITAERADLPPQIANTVMRMLEKKPEDRFPDLASVVAALEAKVLPDTHPARSKLIELAKTGAMMRPRMSVPMSPSPANKNTPRSQPTMQQSPSAAAKGASARPAAPSAAEKKSSTGLIIGVAAAVVVAAGGGWYAMQSKGAASGTPAPIVAAGVATPATQTPEPAPDAVAPAVVDPNAAAGANGAAPTNAAPANGTPANAPANGAPAVTPPVTAAATPPAAEPPADTKAGRGSNSDRAARAAERRKTIKAALARASTKQDKADLAAKLKEQEEELIRLRNQTESEKLKALASSSKKDDEITRLKAAAAAVPAASAPAPKVVAEKPAEKAAPAPAGEAGTLRIGLNIEDAKIEINGESKGTLGSAVRSFSVKAGTVRWAVRKDGCLPAEGSATVEPGATVTVGRSKATPTCN